MERAHLDGNRREYELTTHYSLVMNDPQALIQLKGLGRCEIELPEALFDGDYPGHYMRRIKSVSLTVPAVVGPYTSLNCTLTLLRDKTRVKATPADGYAERDGEEDDRFLTNRAPLQAIAASSGQNGRRPLRIELPRRVPPPVRRHRGRSPAGASCRTRTPTDSTSTPCRTWRCTSATPPAKAANG